MDSIFFDGKTYAQQWQEQIRNQGQAKPIKPSIAWIASGNDPASQLYGKLKAQAAQRLGIHFQQHWIGSDQSFKTTMDQIKQLNRDPAITGILAQLPVLIQGQRLAGTDLTTLLSAIDPSKDIDCLTPTNLGLVLMGQPRVLPATVRGIMEILQVARGVIPSPHRACPALDEGGELGWGRNHKETTSPYPLLKGGGIAPPTTLSLSGLRVLLLGGSLEVGKPLVHCLSDTGATVIWVRSSERNLSTLTKKADIVISATGKPGLIEAYMLKKGVIAIDVGSPKGDINPQDIESVARFYTPVPGGVGPITVTALMANTIDVITKFQ